MEKKSTKIAYFVALGVFIVLLVILGITFKGAPLPTLEVDGEMIEATTPFAGTFWSLLPPIVAIVLALISKEVYSSLFLGCLVGILLPTSEIRDELIKKLREKEIIAYICYVPLHSAPYGLKLGYKPEDCPVTEDIASRLLRLPLYADMSEDDAKYVCECIKNIL